MPLPSPWSSSLDLVFQFALLAIGLGLLWKIGGMAVQNAIGFSDIFGISRFTIGFFIFAISTGLPEISSTIVASLKGVPELSSGTLMGSTFVNLTLSMGIVVTLAKKIEIESPLRKKLFWTSLLILIIFAELVIAPNYQIFSGIILIIVYIGSFFLFQPRKQLGEAKREIEEIAGKVEESEKKALISPKIDITGKLLISLALLVGCSWITVHAAANISEMLDIGVSIIGASLVAIGTGLPEIALEVHAVRRREYALALGDIFGSSLLNVSLVLGILLLMNRQVDLSIAKVIFPFVIAAIGWTFVRLIPQKPFKRVDGVAYFGLLAVYLVTLGILQSGHLGL